eukprot:g30598.t1
MRGLAKRAAAIKTSAHALPKYWEPSTGHTRCSSLNSLPFAPFWASRGAFRPGQIDLTPLHGIFPRRGRSLDQLRRSSRGFVFRLSRMAVSSATAFDVMSSPESIQICKDWRSVTSECECSTTIASVPQLPADFPCYAAIKEHGQLIAKVLRLAKQCGDRVAIVSLSERPWVFESADQYLPGLDMAELLKELQIPVYYASEHTRTPTSTAWGELPEEEDLHVLTKRNAMLEFLQASQGPQTGLHLISIGDSLVEKEAAQACARLADLQTASLCKTIKLIGDPSLKQLTEQLQTLAMHLPSICAYESDLDLHAQSPDDLVSQLATVGPDP